MFGEERTLLVSKFSLMDIGKVWCFISFWRDLDLLLNKVKDKGRARARETATSMNMTVNLDTYPQADPTYEDATEKAVMVVSPLSAFSGQMKQLKSLKSGKNSVESIH